MDNKYNINYNNYIVEYKIERTKRKTICIVVKDTGDVFVRIPLRMPNYKATEFVESKKKWIFNKVVEQKKKNRKISFENGSLLKVLGNQYELKIEKYDKKRIKVFIKDDKLIALLPEEDIEDEKEKIQKAYEKFIFDIAKKEITDSIDNISNIVGLKPNTLKIRSFKRAWGNCSSKKVISINKELGKYNKNAINYVCLHEICHLKYMNHSKRFWNMVESYMPNYKEVEKELK